MTNTTELTLYMHYMSICTYVCMCACAQSCLTLCDPHEL